MSEAQDTATEHLVDIIHAILLSQQTGTLQVERGAREALETGSITFANGQVVIAHTGSLSGLEALEKLRSWKKCRFRFIEQSLSEISPSALKDQTRSTSLTSRLAGMMKQLKSSQRDLSTSSTDKPTSQTGEHTRPTPSSPLTSPSSKPLSPERNSGYLSSSNTGPHTLPGQDTDAYLFPLRDTGPHRLQGPNTGSHRLYGPSTGPFPSREQSTGPYEVSEIEKRQASAPRRLFNETHLIQQLGFSRNHNRVFLLIDGQRTPTDLARVTHQSLADVQHILEDLLHMGLISY